MLITNGYCVYNWNEKWKLYGTTNPLNKNMLRELDVESLMSAIENKVCDIFGCLKCFLDIMYGKTVWFSILVVFGQCPTNPGFFSFVFLFSKQQFDFKPEGHITIMSVCQAMFKGFCFFYRQNAAIKYMCTICYRQFHDITSHKYTAVLLIT